MWLIKLQTLLMLIFTFGLFVEILSPIIVPAICLSAKWLLVESVETIFAYKYLAFILFGQNNYDHLICSTVNWSTNHILHFIN
jgi:hypothetical protein